jgi:hypothetical protein
MDGNCVNGSRDQSENSESEDGHRGYFVKGGWAEEPFGSEQTLFIYPRRCG